MFTSRLILVPKGLSYIITKYFSINKILFRNLVELRKTYGDQFLKKHNLKLGFMSAFLKSAASALQDQPAVNAGILPNLINITY